MNDEPLNRMPTPCLLLDIEKLDRNIARMRQRVDAANWQFRPHLKTCKSVDVARRCFGAESHGPITVSTLREAEYFADAGYTDVLYAVSIVPDKLDRVIELLQRGVYIQVILDEPTIAERIGSIISENGLSLPVWIEVDCDGHRAGISANRESDLIDLARLIDAESGLQFAGVMTHAGESYGCTSASELRTAAIEEQDCIASMATAITRHGISCPGRSIGSSPTGMSGTTNRNITELRAGVFMFQDLFQSNLGVCNIEDIAVSVLTTVISHRRDLGWLIVDAGGLALSKDRSTASQSIDYGFGLPCNVDGRPLEGHIVASANQEHGIISRRDGEIDFERFPIGSRLKILPNHACMTAAAYEGYHVFDNGNAHFWPRINGW